MQIGSSVHLPFDVDASRALHVGRIGGVPVVRASVYPEHRQLKIYDARGDTGLSALRGSRTGRMQAKGGNAPASALQFDLAFRLGRIWQCQIHASPVFKLFPSTKTRYGAFGLNASCRDEFLDQRFSWGCGFSDVRIRHFVFSGEWHGTLAWRCADGVWGIVNEISNALEVSRKCKMN